MQQKSELPEGWANTTISEVGKITTGNTPPKKDPKNYGNEYPWVKPGDLDKNAPITETEEGLSEKGASLARLLPINTVLVSCIGNLGKLGIAGTLLATNQQINSISFEETIVYPKYGYYYCKTLKKWLEENSSATTIPIINKTRFSEAPFYLPPLPEQHRIVSAIEALFARLDATNERLDKMPEILKSFKQAVLNSACDGRLTEDWRKDNSYDIHDDNLIDSNTSEQKLNDSNNLKSLPSSWKWVNFGFLIGEMKNGISTQPNNDPPGNKILRINAVRPGMVDLKEHKYLPNSADLVNLYKLKEHDLLFTRYSGSEEYVGGCGLVKHIGDDIYLYPDKLIRVRFDSSEILAEYCEIFFMNPLARQRIIASSKSSAGQRGISGKNLKTQPFALPPLPEQEKIVQRINALFAFADSIEAKVAAAREKTEKLRQSILAKAFSGELVETEAEIARREGRGYETAEVLIERIKAKKKISKKK